MSKQRKISQYVKGKVSHIGAPLTGEKCVSERTLLARFNRILDDEGEIIRKCGEHARLHFALGDYYCINARTKKVTSTHIDLDEYSRALYVLENDEVITK